MMRLGAKAGAGVYQMIINQIPPHENYVEGFLGSGVVMRHKRPAKRSFGFDVDIDVIQARRADLQHVPDLNLLQVDTLKVLRDLDVDARTMLYLDPPYLLSAQRRLRALYRYELADAQHIVLLKLIRRLPCMVMISGYWSDLYSDLLPGWRALRYWTVTPGVRGRPVEECLWMNYDQPAELHDYQYLGRDFRERERIKRRTLRWATRLAKMPITERYALMAALRGVG